MEKELRLIITRACNYDCYFCHGEGVEKSCKSLLDAEDYEFLVGQCKKNFGWNSVTLTGGEPYVRKDCDKILKSLYDIGMKITVVSNGELIDNFLDSFKYVDRLNVSIHSLNEKKYNSIIQRENKLSKVISNLNVLREKNDKVDIRLNTTIVNGVNSDPTDYDQLISLAKSLNASIKIIELFSENKNEIVPLNEIQSCLIEKGFKLKSQDLFKNTLTDGQTNIVLSKIFCAMANDYFSPTTFCNNNDIFITPDGKIKLCRYSEVTIDILNEIKNRDQKMLKRKFLMANDMLGKACPFIYKDRMTALAIDGGKPLLERAEGKFIHPKITTGLVHEVVNQLKETISIYDDSGIFKEFEDSFKKYHNKKYGLVTSSGTAAIWSMYDAINLKPGDEVICPIYTFFATVSPIFQTGAVPVFVDCDETGNMDWTKIEEKVTSKTKAIIVVHIWGYPAKMDKIREISNRYELYLLEDCSHAHGGEYKGKKLGEWGDAAAFSIQGNKIITGGEGGILITSDYSIYKNSLLLGHYNKRCKQELKKSSIDYQYADTGKGLKLRAHPIAIRIANHMFKHLDEYNSYKTCYAEMVTECVKDIDGLSVVQPYEDSKCAYYALIIKFDESKFKVTRDDFVKALQAEGCVEFDIPSSTAPLNHFKLFNNPEFFFKTYQSNDLDNFENAEKFYNSIIKMPVWYSPDDWLVVYKYCEALKKVAKAYWR